MSWKDKKWMLPLLIFMTGNITGGAFQTVTLGSVALADIQRHEEEIKECKETVSHCGSMHQEILNEIHNGTSEIKDMIIDNLKSQGHEHLGG